MNICFFIASMGKGGAERVIATLSNYCAGHGDKVTIVTLWNKQAEYYLDETVSYVCLDLERENNSILEKAAGAIKTRREINRQIKRIKPDIIISYSPKLTMLCKIAGINKPVIGMEGTNPSIRRSNKVIALSIRLSSIADGFVFQTIGAKRCYPYATQKKSVVIPNPVTDTIPLEATSYRSRRKCICGVGRLEAVKRFDILIEAFARITDKYPDYSLHIFGDGSLRLAIEKQIQGLGLQNRVILEGKVENVPEILSNMRVFALTSQYEGMPNALIEAMACGCACISVDCDFGPADLIQDGINGILVPTGSVIELEKAMDRILSDTETAEHLSKNAMAIRTRLSAEVISEQYRNYFEKVSGIKNQKNGNRD